MTIADREVTNELKDTTSMLGITWDRDEAVRIMRASTLHGVLNTSARLKELNAAQIKDQTAKCERRLTAAAKNSALLAEAAANKLRSAAARLSDPRERRRERAARKKMKYTRQIASRIDVSALRQMKHRKTGHGLGRREIKENIWTIDRATGGQRKK